MKKIISAIAFGVLIFVLASAAHGQACAPVPPGLVSFWPGEGAANDLQGTNNGTLQNGAGFTDSGRVGPAFALDGNNDRVALPSMNIGSAYTVEFWMYPTRANSFQHLFSNGWTGGNNYGALYFNTSAVSYWQGGFGRLETSGTIPLNQWTHVALTYDGAVNQIYVNAVASGLPSVVHTETFDNPAMIGFNILGESSHFQGRLDDISLYSTALSPLQISFIHNAGRSGKCIAPGLTVDDATVLEGNSGTSNLNFNVRSIRSTAPATVDYATTSGTATAPDDYTSLSGSTNVPASGTATVSVLVNGDTTLEPNETLFLDLSSPVGATLADAQGIGTIFGDDCVIAPSGLNNWWRADGNAEDSVGAADGTAQFGTAFTTGLRGQAFGLDGVNASVLTPTINIGSVYTVQFWMYPTSSSIFQETVSNNYQSSMFGSLYFNNNHMEYWQGSTTRNTSAGTIPLNQWTYVALTYDGNLSQLYVDGVPSGAPNAHAGEVFNNPVRFGHAIANGSFYFRGLLDEITLFNRALSPAEIQSIYGAFGGGVCLAPTAAGVEVSGRVLAPDGRGVRGARVSITDQNGQTRMALTSSFGYYRFDDVTAGQSYVVGASGKGYTFAARTLSVVDTLTDVDFVGDVFEAGKIYGEF